MLSSTFQTLGLPFEDHQAFTYYGVGRRNSLVHLYRIPLAKTCPQPNVKEGMTLEVHGLEIGSYATYTCETPGHRFSTGDTFMNVLCLSTSRWQELDDTCRGEYNFGHSQTRVTESTPIHHFPAILKIHLGEVKKTV